MEADRAELAAQYQRLDAEAQQVRNDLKAVVDQLHATEADLDDRTRWAQSLDTQLEQANTRITEFARLSKPGRRYYVSAQEIPVVKRGRGLVIISTSKGLMTGEQARAQHVGGELICKIY